MTTQPETVGDLVARQFDLRILSPLVRISIVAMMLGIPYGAMKRFMGDPQGWVDPLFSQVGMPLLVFFGLLNSIRHGSNVRMTVLISRLSTRIQRASRFVGQVAGSVFFGSIALGGAFMVPRRWGEASSPFGFTIPAWLGFSLVGLGAFAAAMGCLVHAFNSLGRPEVLASGEDGTDAAAV